MITIDPISVCQIPILHQALKFPAEGDRGNALLLIAEEMQPHTRVAYARAGYVHEGGCISCCDETLFRALDHLELSYCPWPDRGFTLVVLDHDLLSMVADRFVVSRLMADDANQENELLLF